MEVSSFTEKLNKVDGNIYVIEEEVRPVDGVYEALLAHDNINTATLSIWTGPKLTGKRIESYVLSTPGLMPWKKSIRRNCGRTTALCSIAFLLSLTIPWGVLRPF